VYQCLAEAPEGTLSVRDLRHRLDPALARTLDDALTMLSYHGVIDDSDPDEPQIAGTLFRDWYRDNRPSQPSSSKRHAAPVRPSSSDSQKDEAVREGPVMTRPELSVPPSEAPAEPSTPDLPGRPTAKIEELLRERSQLDALLQQQFRREVTLLFSDIQGSTAYFERRGDLSGRQMVQRHNDLLFPLITQQQGMVLKTIGDAIMASFADPARAVQAAMAIQRALRDHNRAQEAAEQIHIRIGLNSGPALVEPQDIFGDVVNAAARVQACALADQILIAGATYHQLSATIPCRPVGAWEVKGKSAPIELFEVCWEDRP
jgi:class 3 adenylate cyclase